VTLHLAAFGAGVLAGFLNVMAGGGSLITLPILLFLGFPAALANGTNRVAILVQNVAAVTSFRQQGLSDVRTGLRLAAVTLPGAVAGAFISLRVSDATFRVILAAVLIVAVAGLLRPPGRTADYAGPGTPGVATYLALVGVGLYGGFLQAGVGFLFMVVLHRMLRLDLVRTNMYKVFIVLVYTIPTLTVFVWSGNVRWLTGLVLAAGSAAGAVIATRVSVRGGERYIRPVVAVALVLMAARLVVQNR
jgi:hypothetical protein